MKALILLLLSLFTSPVAITSSTTPQAVVAPVVKEVPKEPKVVVKTVYVPIERTERTTTTTPPLPVVVATPTPPAIVPPVAPLPVAPPTVIYVVVASTTTSTPDYSKVYFPPGPIKSVTPSHLILRNNNWNDVGALTVTGDNINPTLTLKPKMLGLKDSCQYITPTHSNMCQIEITPDASSENSITFSVPAFTPLNTIVSLTGEKNSYLTFTVSGIEVRMPVVELNQ